jgi:alpha-galactosidase
MDYLSLHGGEASLVVAMKRGAPPAILHWGPRLPDNVDPTVLTALAGYQGGPGSADVFVSASLAMEAGLGLLGPSGIVVHRAGQDWGSRFVVTDAAFAADRIQIFCRDDHTQIGLTYDLRLDAVTGILTVSSALTNLGEGPLEVTEFATAVLPIANHMTDLIGFTGRWALEFQRERIKRFAGTYLRESRRGRTSHDGLPALILCGASTDEAQGEAYGLHLGWSGNHRIRVDSLHDGRVFAGLGALLGPGEIRLEQGQTFHAPTIHAAYSREGLSGLSQRFHAHVRRQILRPETRTKVRPVHYNTWEAVYFDHDLDRLKAIADRAVAVGVERFVLDDGWFGSRRDDTSGLGDWYVSADVYPDGLKPLIDYVTGLGMEMGIWFEPEMVNPDSDLYRAHPDWVLGLAHVEQVPFRNQLVLDISRPEVSDYLFARIDAVLRDHEIAYVKWDMNRDISHPGDRRGYQRSHAQVDALYALLQRLRDAHPSVEFESCASGGARADYGVLSYTDRIWTSDSNDALDRQDIQRGASFFFPLEVLGAHVGPRRCHITGRTLSMAMRAGTAMIGHMGLELNLLEETETELAILKEAIACHKAHRDLLHTGNLVRLQTSDELMGMGVIAQDQSEALYSIAILRSQVQRLLPRVLFHGLDPDQRYRVKLVWPSKFRSWSAGSSAEALDLTGEGKLLPGRLLQEVGFGLPLTVPEQVLIFHLRAYEPD